MEISYDIVKLQERAAFELAFGCFAGCCTNVDRGGDY